MRIQSALGKKQWLSSMKDKMDSSFSFGAERFTGTILGSFFRVTYHSGHEWNRRISNEKNTAIGYVVETADGCEVRCIRTKGILYPGGFLMCWAVLCALLGIGMLGSGQVSWISLALCVGIGFLTTAISAPLTAFFECFTEQSQQGQKVLTATLIDPSDPFAYLTHQNKL